MSADFRSTHRVYEFCCYRAKRLASLIHATSHIPLTERQIVCMEERMYKAAREATSDDEVTVKVNGVQDAFVSECHFRTPRMWNFCKGSAIQLAFRLSLEYEQCKKNGRQLSIAWRRRTSRRLRIRMFSAACSAANDTDVNARIGNVHNAVLIEHGIAPDV